MAKKRHTAMKAPKLTEDNWHARQDMHTLKEAAAVKSDPKRHAAAKDHARHEAHMLKKVAGRKS